MKNTYKNRYGDTFTFTLDDNGDILWEGNFEFHRIGYPNDYTKAYSAYLQDREGSDPETLLSLEEFKRDVHEYQEDRYLYPEYVKLVESMPYIIDMVDPSGGCYLSSGMSLDFLGFKNCIIEKFEHISTGYKIITNKYGANTQV
jgi:hypothetical protein